MSVFNDFSKIKLTKTIPKTIFFKTPGTSRTLSTNGVRNTSYRFQSAEPTKTGESARKNSDSDDSSEQENKMQFKIGDIVKFDQYDDFGMVIDVGVNWVSAVLDGGSTVAAASTNFTPAPKHISIFKVWLNTKEIVATQKNWQELNTLSMEWRREIL